MASMKNNDAQVILITGGAGYIGSVTAALLLASGYRVIIIDRLDHKQKEPDLNVHFIYGDCADKNLLVTVFQQYSVHAVVHCAGYIEVGESVVDPSRFYHNNVALTITLLDVMRQYNVNNIIFSSTCAVYGNPERVPMCETHVRNPVSPYGRTKLAIEFILQDYQVAYGINFVGLRYFNAAGALPAQNLGEKHSPETHIIPLLLRSLKTGSVFKIFGNDYETLDGTCVRDYVHVADIACAHMRAIAYLDDGKQSDFFNLGTGKGYSVLELIKEAQEICQGSVKLEQCKRREGDAPVLVADPCKAETLLGWKAECSDLKTIISSAWEWERSLV